MSLQSLQVSRAVLGFPRVPRLRRLIAAGFLVAAAVCLAPGWWASAAASAIRWAGRFWLVVVLVSVAAALLSSSRRDRARMAVGRRPRTPVLPLFVHVALLLVVAAAVTAAVGALLWPVLRPPTQPIVVSPAAASGSAPGVWTTQDTLDAVKVVLTVVGGIGAVVALTVAYRRQRLSEVAAYREDTKVLLDRFCAATGLLGSPDASVRIAGIYAYAALANDAPEGRQGCIDVLCAYLRQPYNPPPDGAAQAEAPPQQGELPSTQRAAAPASWAGEVRDPRQERQVRQTIIRLIRDNLHLPDDDPRTWRGHDFNLCGAVLDGADFTGATFTDAGTVTFDDATITGRLSFASATFAGGTVTFNGTRFAGGSMCLSGATFTGGVVDLSRVDGHQPPSMSELWPVTAPIPTGLRLPAMVHPSPPDGGRGTPGTATGG